MLYLHVEDTTEGDHLHIVWLLYPFVSHDIYSIFLWQVEMHCQVKLSWEGRKSFFLDLMLHCVHNEETKSQKCTRDTMTHVRKLRIHYIKVSTIISITKGIHVKIIIWNIVGSAYNRLFRILIIWIKCQLKSFPWYGSCCIEKVHPYPRGHHNECNMLTRWGKNLSGQWKANASCVYIRFICNNVMLDVVSQYGHIDRCQSIHAWHI